MTRIEEIEENYGFQTGGPENDTIQWLIARIKKLEAALEFYADENIYAAYDNHGLGDESKATNDNGEKARAALKEDGE